MITPTEDSPCPSFARTLREASSVHPIYPAYTLLHLGRDPGPTFDAIVRALAISSDPEGETRALLAGDNWRDHLIGAFAAILGRQQSYSVAQEIWRAFDEGSWVSPQLAVVASLIDPHFVEQARKRIDRRCRGIPDRTDGMPWIERHSVSGPNGEYYRNCKALSALLAACEPFGSLAPWLAIQHQAPDIQRMVADDPDYGNRIVIWWRTLCVSACRGYVERVRGRLVRPT